MSQPFYGEIRIFAGNFAPVGWALCNGQLMAIAENPTLFNLIGTTFGGDGQQTFALPDLRGRLPLHQGQGPGLSNKVLGQLEGVETVTLTQSQLPAHQHPVFASAGLASEANPASSNVLAEARSLDAYLQDVPSTSLAPTAVTSAGGSQPHDNTMPYLCINFIISLFGIYPSQT
jgi:microcystin-dependent protein